MWYLVTTKYSKEHEAQENLENQGFETYLPLIDVEKIVKGKRKTVTEPAFPKYIFIKFDPELLSASLVRNTHGVGSQGIVRFGNGMTDIPWYVIENMKKMFEDYRISRDFMEGEAVRVSIGGYGDIEAIFKRPVGADRSEIMLSLLNQQQLLIIDNKSITTCR